MEKILFLTGLVFLVSSGASYGAQSNPRLVEQGEYLARAGDCVACHTAVGGKPFTGGLAIKSPIGVIYSTNITPDPAQGIGGYSLEEFANALRQGVRKDGRTLYPAMPYPSYSRLNNDDIKALYTYFMEGVKAEPTVNKETEIPWPLSMRWPLRVWRGLFAPEAKPFDPHVYSDPQVARGSYLVQGLGHCGSCHTPRGMAMQEKALGEQQGEHWLAGGTVIDGWSVPNLGADRYNGLGNWSEDELVAYLKTGRTDRTASFGPMTDVISWSTQYLTDTDLQAIAKYLKTLPARQSEERVAQSSPAPHPAGEAIYDDNCAICHGRQGEGIPRMFPQLRDNAIVTGPLPDSLVKIIREGATLPAGNWAPSTVSMPGYADRLSAQQTADLINYLRGAWGNHSSTTFTAQDIEKIIRDGGNAGAGNTAGWSIMQAQPYGKQWTFQIESHHDAQDNPK